MRNKILITVTDIYGSKHFTISKIIKKLLLYSIIFVTLLLIFSGTAIYYLSKKVDILQKETLLLENKKDSLQSKNRELYEKIQAKSQELSSVNEKIQSIEELLGIKPAKEVNLITRVEAIHPDAALKSLMLQLIPNGSPVPYNGITGKYGNRIHPILKKKEFHQGIDLRAPLKTPVRAPADGIVEFAGPHKRSGFGVLLILDHAYGFKTLYGHLYKCKVKTGDFVKKGDIIAYTGNSGLSNGPHLHYEIRYLQISLNPLKFIKWDLKNFDTIFRKEKAVKWDSLVNQIRRHHLQTAQPSSLTAQK
ncbi:M23 family metallopeptidase [Hydrogenimonas thermophila]|uniref:Murein DD-endopeptidase MepM and murein hydrolase activator NlpD, contain LysM domain n=1 Tax=Hydrogenimonas thermophila TaxID=223786 RepID=A0A1I5NGQ8_9BACT|nr:M23 family metallopeptidase [Hydrogenimonas thermophila]SFP20954.1 Murein DD-endopeptidase MepM and murein hydrolase activator NlpD, contain LysM domain [Hydrogenimonas thermophila]